MYDSPTGYDILPDYDYAPLALVVSEIIQAEVETSGSDAFKWEKVWWKEIMAQPHKNRKRRAEEVVTLTALFD